MTARMLASSDVEREPWLESQRLLEMCCASESFIHASHGAPEPRDALAFVVLANDCPRSLRFSLREVSLALHEISRKGDDGRAGAAERRIGRLRARLDFSSPSELFTGDIKELADELSDELRRLSGDIETAYFPRLPAGVA